MKIIENIKLWEGISKNNFMKNRINIYPYYIIIIIIVNMIILLEKINKCTYIYRINQSIIFLHFYYRTNNIIVFNNKNNKEYD